jgi:hypothetical protein
MSRTNEELIKQENNGEMNIYIESPQKDFSQEEVNVPLCREPWENYYILRRGIVPCCYGNPVLAPMSDWAKVWNSPQLQEIRDYLRQEKLSPYCLKSPSCPIVQRYLEKNGTSPSYQKPPFILRLVNRMLFRIPGRIYRAIKK